MRHEFAWSLDAEGRHIVNVYRHRDHRRGPVLVLSHDDWRRLRKLLDALADIEASDPALD